MSPEISLSTSVKSVCPYCGVGCGIKIEREGEQIIKVIGDKDHPTNAGRLCTKGNTCTQAIANSGRLEHAYIRNDREQDPARIPIDKAINQTAGRLRTLLDEYGPDALAFYVSGQMSLEAQYLVNKLAKGFIRTAHIESNSRLCMASAGSGYKLSLGSDAPPGSYDDFDHADVFFVSGANMADCHPILFLRMMDRIKAGAKLIVVDPRRTGTADKADLYLPIKPGTDLALLNGLLYLLHQNGDTDPAFIAEFTEGWEALPEFLADYTPERVAEITGLSREAIEQAARLIGNANNWMSCWTMGLNQSTHGTWNTNAICNLHLATGAICRTGSGPFSLTGQPNAMGGREMGYMGPGLPGQRSALNENDRVFVENIWGVSPGTIRAEGGNGTIGLFEDMKQGKIKACWVICTNPVASVPNRQTVIDGLKAAQLVIAQDAYLDTETNRYADVLLPGALWAEAEGVMINSERNLTLMQQATLPPGDALPDWQLIARIASAMGYSDAFNYQSAEEVFEEIKHFWNPATGYDIRGASYARLRQQPLQWPCPPDDNKSRHPVRYLNDGQSQTLRQSHDGKTPRFNFATTNGKAVFFARPHISPEEMPSEAFPLVLNTGRVQHQWHTLTKTGKIPTLNKLNANPFVEIHPDDAESLGIKHQGTAEIRSARGSAILPVIITERVRPGTCFAPFHWNDVFGESLAINAVTSAATDPISLQPECKFSAVALRAVSDPEISKTNVPARHSDVRQIFAPISHETCMSLIDTFTQTLNINTVAAPELTETETRYIGGFVAGLKATANQIQAVPALPIDAPISDEHKHWVNGLLAGMFSRVLPIGISAENTAPQLSLLWASQTGNAEELSLSFAKRLEAAGWRINIQAMNEYTLAELARDKFALFVTSTFGDGDAPDSGEDFWQQLNTEDAPLLDQLHFSVLALGDSNYDQFCGHGKKLDARLEAMGASRLAPRHDCDTDFDEPASAWLGSVQQALAKLIPADENSAVSHTVKISPAGELLNNGVSGYTKNNPYPARLVINEKLNAEGSGKDVRCFGFDLGDSGIHYEAGDALGVWPTNCPELVFELIRNLHLNAESPVLVDTHEKTLHQALSDNFEIVKPSPDLLKFIASNTPNKSLQTLLDNTDTGVIQNWLWGRQLVDILHEFPLRLSADEFLQQLKRLQPRLYSIASSSKLHPNQIHLTVSSVRYTRYSDGKKIRKGTCSTFLADRAHHLGIPIFVQPSKHFHVPDDGDAPVIMVGPGTGVAPFRGFLQERQARGDKGKNWLFFGEQHAASDFYYRNELEAFKHNGVLTELDLAFSRDQTQKIYVQDRMRENGQKIWQWLEEGAYFCVCGDASRMAKDVDQALRDIVSRHGGLNDFDTVNYMRKLNMSKRYLKDVY